MTVALVVLGAVIGAPVRYLTDLVVQSRHDTVFPWGTFTVNVVGSFVLGVVGATVAVQGAPTWVLTLIGTGFCGALTTFSTFGFETVRLIEEGSWPEATLNVVASLAVGLAACSLGWWLASSW